MLVPVTTIKSTLNRFFTDMYSTVTGPRTIHPHWNSEVPDF